MARRRFQLRMLLQRKGVWTYRRVIPKDARPFLDGREQIWRSLGCTNFEEAKLKAMEVGLEVERLIHEARERGKQGKTFTPEELARAWQRVALREDAEWRKGLRQTPEEIDAEIEALANAVSDHKEALSLGDTSLVASLLKDVLAQYGIQPSAQDRQRFARALLNARLQAFEVAVQRSQGSQEDGHETVSDVLEAYLKQHRPPSKTQAEWRAVFRRWDAVNGLLPVRAVQKLHVRVFRDSLAAMPSKRSPDGKVSAVTVRKGLAVISSVFQWAVREGYLDHAPTVGITGMRGSKTRDPERTRLPYSTADLNTILTALPSEQESPSKHWLPLLAMWTGARVEELCQLRGEDVGREDGIWFLHIRGGEGRSVKTYSANRRIPICETLRRLGFIAFVEQQRGKPRLFMDLSPGPHNKLSHAFSKWWGRFTDELGISDPRKTFHSTRHGYASACRRVEMPLPIQEALMGHSSGRVSERYGETYPLKVLAEWAGRIAYEGVKMVSS